MVMDQIETKLKAVVEGTSRDLDWATERYEDALESIEERTMEDLTDEEKREMAVAMVEEDQIREDRTFSSGEEMELEILAVGQAGKIDNWGEDNDSVVYSYGFIHGPLGDDGGGKAARAVFVNRASDDLTLSDVQRKFHALNTMTAVYDVSESDDLPGVYRCFSTGTTDPMEQTLDSLPDDRSERVEILRQAIPETSLASLHDDLSAYDPETGYTYDFGADVRRIRGKIVDYYIPDDESWGRYTIMDESVTEDDLVGTDIVDDDQNVPGLTVWADPGFHMEYGRKTRADFYGTIEENDNGNIVMNLVGIVPIVPMPMDEDEKAGEDIDKTEDSI